VKGSNTTRAFLALEIPEQVKTEVDRQRSTVIQRLPRERWVRTANLHLTLKFLGESSARTLDGLSAELGPALAGAGEIRVRLGGGGFFPSPRRPRVAWIGGEAVGAADVARVLEDIASKHGFDRERRSWSLHLTQARLKNRWRQSDVETYIAWGDALRLPEFVCPDVALIASELRPSGAVYTPLARFPLQ
jgi:2'-5' RNA ligase